MVRYAPILAIKWRKHKRPSRPPHISPIYHLTLPLSSPIRLRLVVVIVVVLRWGPLITVMMGHSSRTLTDHAPFDRATRAWAATQHGASHAHHHGSKVVACAPSYAAPARLSIVARRHPVLVALHLSPVVGRDHRRSHLLTAAELYVDWWLGSARSAIYMCRLWTRSRLAVADDDIMLRAVRLSLVHGIDTACRAACMATRTDRR